MVAESVTFPIDLTKTRMQLHGYAPGSASAAHRVGAIGVVSEIMRQEGMMGFYKGLSPAILRHLFYTPIRIIGYENLKGLIVRSEANNGESLPLVTKALLGGLSGVIAQVKNVCFLGTLLNRLLHSLTQAFEWFSQKSCFFNLYCRLEFCSFFLLDSPHTSPAPMA